MPNTGIDKGEYTVVEMTPPGQPGQIVVCQGFAPAAAEYAATFPVDGNVKDVSWRFVRGVRFQQSLLSKMNFSDDLVAYLSTLAASPAINPALPQDRLRNGWFRDDDGHQVIQLLTLTCDWTTRRATANGSAVRVLDPHLCVYALKSLRSRTCCPSRGNVGGHCGMDIDVVFASITPSGAASGAKFRFDHVSPVGTAAQAATLRPGYESLLATSSPWLANAESHYNFTVAVHEHSR